MFATQFLEISSFIIFFIFGLTCLIVGGKIFIQGWRRDANKKRNFKKMLLGTAVCYFGKTVWVIMAIKIFLFLKS